ncbi:hypothetical protein GWI33_019327 [Rhynchophorus ferrugineus]|uniref:Uncharacterized protein n=1 Tax=Rhynchophorus ferrugineus TaxID=354439 RepID=A0A834M0K8_RHYFE|nr:hypothetical protein GWI33_019327 [Rhynchophorus ferrugineus]
MIDVRMYSLLFLKKGTKPDYKTVSGISIYITTRTHTNLRPSAARHSIRVNETIKIGSRKESEIVLLGNGERAESKRKKNRRTASTRPVIKASRKTERRTISNSDTSRPRGKRQRRQKGRSELL